MKKGRNLLNSGFSSDKKKKAAEKIKDLKDKSSYAETLKELEGLMDNAENENKTLRDEFWNELRNHSSISHLKEKIVEGWAPNDLECDKIGILRI